MSTHVGDLLYVVCASVVDGCVMWACQLGMSDWHVRWVCQVGVSASEMVLYPPLPLAAERQSTPVCSSSW